MHTKVKRQHLAYFLVIGRMGVQTIVWFFGKTT